MASPTLPKVVSSTASEMVWERESDQRQLAGARTQPGASCLRAQSLVSVPSLQTPASVYEALTSASWGRHKTSPSSACFLWSSIRSRVGVGFFSLQLEGTHPQSPMITHEIHSPTFLPRDYLDQSLRVSSQGLVPYFGLEIRL